MDREQDEAPDAGGRGGPDEIPVAVAIDRRDPAGLAPAEALDRRDDGLRAGHRRGQGRGVADVARDQLHPVGQPTEGRPAERDLPGQDAD